jgi:hypothetical protein
MVLTRRTSLALLAVAAFQYLSWINFARNLATSDDSHPRGYYIAHTALIVINLVIATWLAWLGRRGLQHADEERVRQFYDDRELDAQLRR